MGTSSQRARKEVTNTTWVKLEHWWEHFLINHIRSVFIWNKGCKTTMERTPMIPDYITPCVVFWGVWPVFRMFTRWILRSAALIPAVHLHHLAVLPVLSAVSADLSWFYPLWKRWAQTIMVAFHPSLPPDVFIITGIGKSADSLYYKDVKFCKGKDTRTGRVPDCGSVHSRMYFLSVCCRESTFVAARANWCLWTPCVCLSVFTGNNYQNPHNENEDSNTCRSSRFFVFVFLVGKKKHWSKPIVSASSPSESSLLLCDRKPKPDTNTLGCFGEVE